MGESVGVFRDDDDDDGKLDLDVGNKLVGAERAVQKVRIRVICGSEAMLPAKRMMRQRPSERRKRENCQGRASAWLRTWALGKRMPRFTPVASAALLVDDASLVLSLLWLSAEGGLATRALLT